MSTSPSQGKVAHYFKEDAIQNLFFPNKLCFHYPKSIVTSKLSSTFRLLEVISISLNKSITVLKKFTHYQKIEYAKLFV